MNPVVSVVVPTYNRAYGLSACLDSLMEQDFRDYEVILSDDGSTDDTRMVANRYPRVQYIAGPNAGPAAARNRGIHRARGEFVVFTDDDCRVPHEWLARIVDGYERHPEVAGVGGYLDPPDAVVQKSIFARYERFVSTRLYRQSAQQEMVGGLDNYPGDGTSNMSYRKAVLDVVGGFDEWFPYAAAEDHDLRVRVHALSHRLLYLPLRVEHMRTYSWASFRRQSIAHGRGVMRWETKTNDVRTPRTRILLRLLKRKAMYPVQIARFRSLSLATVHTAGELLDAYGQWLEWPRVARR
ncbi:MAG: glycosyltransferase [Chloroflexi bacterium]|nr:glycosyltransferase [Chloroflexota bacterium]